MISKFKAKLRGILNQLVEQAVDRSISSTSRPLVYMGGNRALTRTIYGHKMFVQTGDLSLSPHILLDGYWEEWITRAFLREVKDGMVVVDVGANIGYYSILAGAGVGSGGKVHAFEANPSVFDILFDNLDVNGLMTRVVPVNKAVYSQAATLEFNTCTKHQGSSGLFLSEESLEAWRDSLTTISVEAIRLDDYFPRGAVVDLIKIDAEGAEPHVIFGARRVISENRAVQIIIEWSPSLLGRAGRTLRDFYEDIEGLGFSAHQIEHDSTLRRRSFDELVRIDHCDVLLKRDL